LFGFQQSVEFDVQTFAGQLLMLKMLKTLLINAATLIVFDRSIWENLFYPLFTEYFFEVRYTNSLPC